MQNYMSTVYILSHLSTLWKSVLPHERKYEILTDSLNEIHFLCIIQTHEEKEKVVFPSISLLPCPIVMWILINT